MVKSTSSFGQAWRRLAVLCSLGAVWVVFAGAHAFSADVVKPHLPGKRRPRAASTTLAVPAGPILSSTESPRLLRFVTSDPAEKAEDENEADADERPIRALTTNILPSKGELPPNYAAARFAKSGDVLHTVGTSRPWMGSVYDWKASAFCHRPLYFDEPYVERNGHSFGLLQPAVSGAHFFARIPALPYMIAAYPPHECIFTLGHARPGSYAPFRYIRLPLRLDAAAIQAGVVTGLVYLIP